MTRCNENERIACRGFGVTVEFLGNILREVALGTVVWILARFDAVTCRRRAFLDARRRLVAEIVRAKVNAAGFDFSYGAEMTPISRLYKARAPAIGDNVVGFHIMHLITPTILPGKFLRDGYLHPEP